MSDDYKECKRAMKDNARAFLAGLPWEPLHPLKLLSGKSVPIGEVMRICRFSEKLNRFVNRRRLA